MVEAICKYRRAKITRGLNEHVYSNFYKISIGLSPILFSTFHLSDLDLQPSQLNLIITYYQVVATLQWLKVQDWFRPLINSSMLYALVIFLSNINQYHKWKINFNFNPQPQKQDISLNEQKMSFLLLLANVTVTTFWLQLLGNFSITWDWYWLIATLPLICIPHCRSYFHGQTNLKAEHKSTFMNHYRAIRFQI